MSDYTYYSGRAPGRPKMATKMIRLSLVVPEWMHNDLYRLARKSDRSMAYHTRDGIAAVLEARYPRENPPAHN